MKHLQTTDPEIFNLVQQEETGITNVVDPLAGSYYVESLTAELVKEAQKLIDEVEELGGMTRAIQQGAFRRGANMGMMSIDHPDILKFVAAKNDPSAFENFNVSVKVTGAFMSALRDEGAAAHVVVNPTRS